MPSRSLAWHEACLRSQKESLIRERERIERLTAALDRQQMKVDFLEKQIQEAKARRKSGFDSERFLRPVNRTASDEVTAPPRGSDPPQALKDLRARIHEPEDCQ